MIRVIVQTDNAGMAANVGGNVDTVIVEGNYLLLDSGGWERVADLLDVTRIVKGKIELSRTRVDARDAVRARQVAGPQPGGQPVGRIVGDAQGLGLAAGLGYLLLGVALGLGVFGGRSGAGGRGGAGATGGLIISAPLELDKRFVKAGSATLPAGSTVAQGVQASRAAALAKACRH